MNAYWVLSLVFLILFIKDRKAIKSLKTKYGKPSESPLFSSFVILLCGVILFRSLEYFYNFEDFSFGKTVIYYIYIIAGIYGLLINAGLSENSYRSELLWFYSRYVIMSFLLVSLVSLYFFFKLL